MELIRKWLSKDALAIQQAVSSEAVREAERYLLALAHRDGDREAERVLGELSPFVWAQMIEYLSGGVESVVARLLPPPQAVHAVRAWLLLITEPVHSDQVPILQEKMAAILTAFLAEEQGDNTNDRARKEQIIRLLKRDPVGRFCLNFRFMGGGDISADESTRVLASAIAAHTPGGLRAILKETAAQPDEQERLLIAGYGWTDICADGFNEMRDQVLEETIGMPLGALTNLFSAEADEISPSLCSHYDSEGYIRPVGADIVSLNEELFLSGIRAGMASGVLTTERTEAIREKVAKFAMGFAARFSSVLHIPYLEEAIRVVLGIINLGIYALSVGDREATGTLLSKTSPEEVFRTGWQNVAALAKLAMHSRDPLERQYDFGMGANHSSIARSIAVQLMHEPGEPWTGLALFRGWVAKYEAMAERLDLDEWLTQRFFDARAPVAAFSRELASSSETRVKTLLASLLVRTEPHAPLSLSEGKSIVSLVKEGTAAAIFHGRQRAFAEAHLGPRQREAWHVLAEEFYQQLASKQSHQGLIAFRALMDECYREFVFDATADQIDADLLKATFEAIVATDDALLPELISGELGDFVNDRTLQRAVAERIIVSTEEMNEPMLIGMVRYCDTSDWLGRLPWQTFSWNLVGNLFRFRDLADAIRTAAASDLFACYERGEMDTEHWHAMPITFAHRLCNELPPRKRIPFIETLGFDSKEVAAMVKRNNACVPYLRLIGPEGWFDIWSELSNEAIFPLSLFEKPEYFGWSREEMATYLFRIAHTIAGKWEERYEDNAPFYADGLRTAVGRILNLEEMEELTQRLSLSMK